MITINGITFTDQQILKHFGIEGEVTELGTVQATNTRKLFYITDLRKKFKSEISSKTKQKEQSIKRQQNLKEMMPELVDQTFNHLNDSLDNSEYSVFINQTQPNVHHENGLKFYIICGQTYRLGIRHHDFTAEELAMSFPSGKVTKDNSGGVSKSLLVNGIQTPDEIRHYIEEMVRLVNLAVGV